jgi:hypothetical protein
MQLCQLAAKGLPVGPVGASGLQIFHKKEGAVFRIIPISDYSGDPDPAAGCKSLQPQGLRSEKISLMAPVHFHENGAAIGKAKLKSVIDIPAIYAGFPGNSNIFTESSSDGFRCGSVWAKGHDGLLSEKQKIPDRRIMAEAMSASAVFMLRCCVVTGKHVKNGGDDESCLIPVMLLRRYWKAQQKRQ